MEKGVKEAFVYTVNVLINNVSIELSFKRWFNYSRPIILIENDNSERNWNYTDTAIIPDNLNQVLWAFPKDNVQYFLC